MLILSPAPAKNFSCPVPGQAISAPPNNFTNHSAKFLHFVLHYKKKTEYHKSTK